MGYATISNRLRDPSFLFFLPRWLRDLFSFLHNFFGVHSFALRAQKLHIKTKCAHENVCDSIISSNQFNARSPLTRRNKSILLELYTDKIRLCSSLVSLEDKNNCLEI